MLERWRSVVTEVVILRGRHAIGLRYCEPASGDLSEWWDDVTYRSRRLHGLLGQRSPGGPRRIV